MGMGIFGTFADLRIIFGFAGCIFFMRAS